MQVNITKHIASNLKLLFEVFYEHIAFYMHALLYFLHDMSIQGIFLLLMVLKVHLYFLFIQKLI